MDLDVVVVGSIIVDFISYVPRLPVEGETIHGSKFATGFGGKGCNQAVAAHKLGSKTAILCKLGGDSWGKDYLRHLEGLGMVTKFVQTDEQQTTGVAQICVSTESGNNHIVIVAGANSSLSRSDVDANGELLQQAKVLLCQLETPLEGTLRALELMKGISIMNAAPARKDLPESLLRMPTIFCCNETEASEITSAEVSSVEGAKNALHRLRDMGCRTIIITLGGEGAVFMEVGSANAFHVRIPKMDGVRDTTGAGDCFLGALAHDLAQHGLVNLKESIGRACLIAALSVQRLGTQSSFPTSAEAKNWLESLTFDII